MRGSTQRRDVCTDQTPYDFENEYDTWRLKKPRLKYDVSVDPRGHVFWIWSATVSAACFYNMILFSLFVFDDVRDSFAHTWMYVNLVADAVFLCDLAIQSHLAFYEQGVLVTDSVETRQNYLHSSNFFVDLISILPLDLLGAVNANPRIFRCNRFLKVYRINQLIDLSFARMQQVSISLSRVVVVCFLLFHWNACVFFIISVNSDASRWRGFNATFDDDVMLPWPYIKEKITDVYLMACSNKEGCQNEAFYFDEEREAHLLELHHHWFSRNRTKHIPFSNFVKEYTVSMYWSAMTMTTLGEQPSPDTSIQNLFEVLNTIVGLLLFAGIMGSVGDLVANANKVKAGWQTLMDVLKQFMAYRDLNSELQGRVLKYCAYEMAEETILTEAEVRELLPTKLYTQLNASLIDKSLLKSPIFRVSERSFVREISEHLVPRYFSPGEVIVESGQLNTEMLVVVSGSVATCVAQEFVDYGEGAIIGDVNMVWFADHLHENRRQSPVISTSFSQVQVLHRDDFVRILEDHGSFKQRIYRVAHQLQRQHQELPSDVILPIEVEPLEKSLKNVQNFVLKFEVELRKMETRFWKSSAKMKKRLFDLELEVCERLEQARNEIIRCGS
ncbi:unnamed protein product [Caenorhabditis auriculariae]|uniref:Cyclic nucleotide-binding domain-containing protein n=1 Tax=Caenorhabditis auriculariae TaxID=2777116 RepID=A0A8S1HEZ7_9PELO|nr:unnamed protein product [Caenorhabditis auriculariae]